MAPMMGFTTGYGRAAPPLACPRLQIHGKWCRSILLRILQIHRIEHPKGKAAKRMSAKTPEAIFTSMVVAAEMRFGVEKKGSDELAARVEALLGHIRIAALDRDADRHYGRIRAQLEPGEIQSARTT